ncbi:MAG: hypothetical protein FWG35_08080 [Spirochaetaceae bacterium]|nr:hypothetical protein [Spirochaetaceae bacterium]
MIRRAAPCLLIIFLLVPGCTRREETSPATEAAGASPSRPARSSPRAQRPAESSAKPQEVQVYTNPDDPLFGLPLSANLPRDFTLGPLYDQTSADTPGREVYALIAAFFRTLNAGKDVRDYFHPDSRFFLERSLDSALQDEEPEAPAAAKAEPADAAGKETAAGQEPKAEKELQPPGRLKSTIARFRVGEIQFSADKNVAQAEVLIMGTGKAKGRTQGELIAEKKGRRWYIAGLAVDFPGIFLPEKKNEETFDPGPSGDKVF